MMRTYTVHEPPGGYSDRLERAEALVFVRDGFSWGAALLTPFWMLAHGLWLALVAYLVGLALVEGVVWAGGLPAQPAGWLMMALHVLVGFEAASIRRWSLGRRGYAMIGSVNGDTASDCERRFFESWLPVQPFLPAGVTSGSGGSRSGEGRLSTMALGTRRD